MLRDRAGEFQLLLESAGGEEIHTIEATLARACSGACNSVEDLSPEVRSHLSVDAQRKFMERYNAVFNESNDQTKAEHAAWDLVSNQADMISEAWAACLRLRKPSV